MERSAGAALTVMVVVSIYQLGAPASPFVRMSIRSRRDGLLLARDGSLYGRCGILSVLETNAPG